MNHLTQYVIYHIFHMNSLDFYSGKQLLNIIWELRIHIFCNMIFVG